MVSKHQLLGFKINDTTHKRTFVLSNSVNALKSISNEPGFLELLYDGANKVYAQRALKVNNLLAKDNPFNKSVYYSEIEYYVIISGDVLTSPHNKKSYFSYYDKSVVKEIIRSKKISLKNETDLVYFISELDKFETAEMGLKNFYEKNP